MTSPDDPRYYYTRAYREAFPSTSLKEFLETAEEWIYSHSGRVKDLKVFAVDSLRVTLFERRIRADNPNEEALSLLHDKMSAATIIRKERVRQHSNLYEYKTRKRINPVKLALHEVEALYLPPGERLEARAGSIVDSTKADYKSKGRELALVIDSETAVNVLEAQHGVLVDAAAKMNISKKIPKDDLPQQPLLLPFMCAPHGTVYAEDDFIDVLAAELPVTNITFGPVEWLSKTKA